MSNGLNAYTKQSRSKAVTVVKDKRRHARSSLGESTQAPAPRVANTLTRIESAAANNSREPGVNAYSIKNAALAEIKFPLCDAAVRKMNGGEWELADAIVAECSETGDDGVRNESYAKMEAMQQEIAKNHGVELSFERIRKLRKVASAFPPGRRRPAVSLEGHLEAGTPEALDAFINSAPNGTALTRAYIRRQKHPDRESRAGPAEGRTPPPKGGSADGFAKHLQADSRQGATRVKRRRANGSTSTSAAASAKSPNRFPRRCHQRTSRLSPSPKTLSRLFVLLLTARGFDPAADNIKQAIADFVKAVLAQQQ